MEAQFNRRCPGQSGSVDIPCCVVCTSSEFEGALSVGPSVDMVKKTVVLLVPMSLRICLQVVRGAPHNSPVHGGVQAHSKVEHGVVSDGGNLVAPRRGLTLESILESQSVPRIFTQSSTSVKIFSCACCGSRSILHLDRSGHGYTEL